MADAFLSRHVSQTTVEQATVYVIMYHHHFYLVLGFSVSKLLGTFISRHSALIRVRERVAVAEPYIVAKMAKCASWV